MEALHIWVEEYCLSFDITDDEFDNMSDIDKVLMVGKHIFSKPEMSYDELCAQLSALVHLDIESSSDIGFVEECCFICAVGEHSTQRDDSVKIIMILEPEYQMYLMNIVKNNMPAEVDSSSDPVEEETEFKIELGEATTEESEQEETEDEPTTVAELEPDEASGDIIASAEANKLLGLNLQKNHEVVDLELRVMEQNAQIAQQAADITELKQSTEQLVEQLENQKDALLRSEAMEDELEILREKAAGLDAAELQIEKYRDKLDELTETKQQYKDEVAAHSAHYTSLLALEAEVEGLKKFRSQVDEYRSQVAESKIAFNELTVRSAEQAEVIALYKASESSSSAHQQHSTVHTQSLSAQLNASLERIRELETGSEGGARLGAADNECNPALMQELEHLKSTNAEYRKMLDTTSVAHLEELQKTNEDLDVMNVSLQKKLTCTKDALTHANREIENYKRVIAQLKREYKDLQGEFAEAAQMSQEHTEAEHGRTTDKLNVLRGVLADTKQCLEVVEAEAEALAVTKASLEHSLNDTQGELAAAKETIEEESTAHTAEVASLKRKYSEDVQSQYEEAQAQFTQLQEQCQESINQEVNKLNASSLELEEERTKRRRVERDKKYHEAEVHRLKLLANANNNSGGSADGGSASSITAKEFKRMEVELEAARTEVAELKAYGCAATGGSGTGGIGSGGIGSGSGAPARLSTRSSARIGSSTSSATISADQLDMADKRCAQLTQEKRDLLAKQIQENQEKLELNQKLIAAERECAGLKSKVTKANLDKERLERKLTKLQTAPAGVENVQPLTL